MKSRRKDGHPRMRTPIMLCLKAKGIRTAPPGNPYIRTTKTQYQKNFQRKFLGFPEGNIAFGEGIQPSRNKNISVLGFAALLILLMHLIFSVAALGITPGRTTITFESGLEKEIEISVINNEHKLMKVMIMSEMQDDLNSSVSLFKDYLDFLPDEQSKSVRYKIQLPQQLNPGLHTGDIVALENSQSSTGETFVGATVAVVSQLHIYVPCPGKCIDADLNIMNTEQNSTASFIVPVISRGKLGIGSVRAAIDIFQQNEKVATAETNSAPLSSGERTELSAKWNVNVAPGRYLARASVFYDGESKSIEKEFVVGNESLSIDSIRVNNFQLGEIAKIQIMVENKFNNDFTGVFANLLIYDDEQQVMANVKSATENIPARSKKELIAYWDTVGVKVGNYNGKLIVNSGKIAAEKNIMLKVSENSLDVVGVGYAINASGKKGVDITTILLILVILLLVVNLAWFVFFRRIIGKKK